MRLRWVVPPLAAVAAFALSACDLDYSSTEDDKTEHVGITEIRISGGGGDVTVRPGQAGQAQIHRKIRYWGDEPSGDTYRIEGNTLYLDTDCGRRCDVSYDVRVPEGAKVSGDNGSGDVRLTGVSTVDLEVASGDLSVTRATGPVRAKVHSGDLRLSDIAGDVNAKVDSGDIRAANVRAAATSLAADSGDITLDLASAGNVTAEASSGDVTVRVPSGTSYRVDASANSGDKNVEVPTDPNGRYQLTVRASSGDISVTASKAG